MDKDFKEIYGKGLGLILSSFDKRDYHFGDMLPMDYITIPEEYQTPDADFAYDQGQSSMCCACAYNFIRFLQERDQSGLIESLSPAYTYAGRDANEMYEGMNIRSCLKHGLNDGNVLWKELPGFGTLDEMVADRKAKESDLLIKSEPFKPSSYYTCTSRKEIQAAIISTKAVLIGIPVYDNVYKPENNKIEYIQGLGMEGGHAIALYGWKIIDGKFYWRMKNSWGADWADKGSAYLSADYPWIENAWAIVDKHTEMTYKEYTNKFYPKENN
jgi:hypothetical protein